MPNRQTVTSIPIGVNAGTLIGGAGGVLTYTQMVSVFVPSFEPMVMVSLCAPSESPDVSIVTVTVSASVVADTLSGLTVIHD